MGHARKTRTSVFKIIKVRKIKVKKFKIFQFEEDNFNSLKIAVESFALRNFD